jgi:hypothetical protein
MDETWFSDDEQETEDPLEFEDWKVQHSEQLLDEWFEVEDAYRQWYLECPYTYDDYCFFCFTNSKWRALLT